MTIWSILVNNERGAIFQLLPPGSINANGVADPQQDSLLAQNPRFVTLNQVNVKIAGGSDKLLVIRDVTSIVLNEQIMETKKEMSTLTDVLMQQVREMAQLTGDKLERLDPYV